MNKVYKGRQKLSLEQAAGYYSFAYKIGVDHGERTEQNRIIELLRAEMPLVMQEQYIDLIRRQQD